MTKVTLTEEIQTLKEQLNVSEKNLIGDIIQPCDVGAYFLGKEVWQWYYAIAWKFRPRRILEIGVRFGYSLKAMCLGSGQVREIFGYDNEYDHKGSLGIARYNIARLVSNYSFFNRDTQTLDDLDGAFGLTTMTVDSGIGKVDLAHVDGWHSEDGCYHDCCLVYPHLRAGSILLIDDCKDEGEVKRGAEKFCRERGLIPNFLPSFTDLCIVVVGDYQDGIPTTVLPERPFPEGK